MARSNRPKRSAYQPPVRYSAAELIEFECLDMRVDYASSTSQLAKHPTLEGHAYQRELAHKVPAKFGHLPLRQGFSIECSRCGMSGTAQQLLNGDVFWFPCGTANYFGHEETIEQIEARIRWEHSRAIELEALGDPNSMIVAEGHRGAAAAYKDLLATKKASSKS